ncbi:MAG TPA: GAF domain-containing protein [Fimbriimonas sp.]|nr:GAF domain-containing protein [Fimbriimonas sp.]
MISAPIAPNELERIAVLRSYRILDTSREEGFEDIVDSIRSCLKVPIAYISLIDSDRQWLKARRGLTIEGSSRDIAFCAHAILQQEPMVVKDARSDIRFHDNPLVKGPPFFRFYLGAPIVSPENVALGTVCAVDNQPIEPGNSEIKAMKFFARQTMRLLELHRLRCQMADRSSSEPSTSMIPFGI